MRLYLEELYKIMKKRYGCILLLGMVVTKLLFGFFLAEDSHHTNFLLEENKKVFLQYEKELGGKLTKQKQKKIKFLMKQQNQANEFLLEQGKLLTEGTITMEEYQEHSIKEREILQKREVINLLNEQYQYAKINKEHRFLLYPNGWINFFQKAGKDFFCFFCIIFLTTAVFLREFEQGTHKINLVCICGRKTLYYIKWCVALTIAILFSIFSYFTEIIIAAGRYGLKHSFYPLQSLSLFEDCPWNISLIEAAVLILFLKMIGTIVFTSLLQFCCLFFQKTAPCLVTSLLLTAIPYFFLSKKLLYSLPIPISFFLLDGFLSGIYNMETGHYDFFSKKEFLILTGQVLFLISCFILVGYFFYQGSSYCKYKIRNIGKKWRKKSIKIFTIFLLLPLFFFCQCGIQEKVPILHNYENDTMFENSTEIFTVCGNSFIRKEKEKKKEEPLFLNLFWDEKDYETTRIIYVTESDIYYIKYYEFDQYDIVRFDLKQMEEHILYCYRDSQAKGYNYLGIIPEPDLRIYHNQKRSQNRVINFWLDGSYLYLVKDDKVEQVNQYTKKKITIIKNAASNVSYYNGKIYYLSTDYILHCYCIETKKTEQWETYPIQYFKLLEKNIVFYTLDEQIGYCNHNWKKINLLGNNYGILVDATERYFYCKDTKGTVTAFNYQGESKRQNTFPTELVAFTSGRKDDWFGGIIRDTSGTLKAVYGNWDKEKE